MKPRLPGWLAGCSALVVACSSSGTPPSPTQDASALDVAVDGPAADVAAVDSAPVICPTSCPAGQIIVKYNDSSPGFPGPSGCDCKADPCADGGTADAGCSCSQACSQLAHGGCCSWSGSMLVCNECG